MWRSCGYRPTGGVNRLEVCQAVAMVQLLVLLAMDIVSRGDDVLRCGGCACMLCVLRSGGSESGVGVCGAGAG